MIVPLHINPYFFVIHETTEDLAGLFPISLSYFRTVDTINMNNYFTIAIEHNKCIAGGDLPGSGSKAFSTRGTWNDEHEQEAQNRD